MELQSCCWQLSVMLARALTARCAGKDTLVLAAW